MDYAFLPDSMDDDDREYERAVANDDLSGEGFYPDLDWSDLMQESNDQMLDAILFTCPDCGEDCDPANHNLPDGNGERW